MISNNSLNFITLSGMFLLVGLHAGDTAAQVVADDVGCTQCVNAEEIVLGEVTIKKLADAAVQNVRRLIESLTFIER